ncbi:hypothetical protein KIN20_019222 [Parelaphostrongylus tenuis]|uniref:BZIP domain-containing protein n=1 Tax=Parelaphostrongylus tenuis TaxID=148309 RepID=A0AAD5N2W4_PARTN|nr:hypothetical protein KIN20_019222 [Parelaphostrongylus tenuis]
MVCDFFRSESEDSARFAVPSARCVSDQATCEGLFYSVQYEEELLMKYIGESAVGHGVGESDDAELSVFDPFIFGELPSYVYIDPTHSPISCPQSDESSTFSDSMHAVCELKELKEECDSPRPAVYQPPSNVASIEKSSSRRGRPMKVTSTSKMANYARNYRELKKKQLLACEAQIKELTEENAFLRSENKRLTEGFARLTEQVNDLRRMVESHSYAYRDPLQTPRFSHYSYEKDSTDTVTDIGDFITFTQ